MVERFRALYSALKGDVNPQVSAAASSPTRAAGADPAVFLGLTPPAYVARTVSAPWWARSRGPPSAAAAHARRRCSVAGADRRRGLDGSRRSGGIFGWTGAIALGLTHVVVGVVAVLVFRRLLPLPR